MSSVTKSTDAPHPFWSIGFRPFFFLGIVQALLASTLWTLHYTGWIQINVPFASNFTWHAATMTYGFVFSIFVGFLLTASANWTKTKPISGTALKWYFLAFALAQLLWFLPSLMPLIIYKYYFLLVYTWLAIFLLQLFVKTKNYKNIMIIFPMGLLATGVFFVFSKDTALSNLWMLIGLGCIRAMLVIIGGRVIPFFSKMALMTEVKPAYKPFELLLMILMVALIFEPLFQHTGPWGSVIWACMTSVAIILNLVRMVSWPFKRALKSPILFVLYVGYSWIVIHLLLSLGLHFNFISELGRPSIHALTYGAMGIMIIAMVSRVSLGHTGRSIHASKTMIASYLCVCFGAVVRVFAPMILPSMYLMWIEISGMLWFLSFILLAFSVCPMLFTPRPDQA